MATVKPFRGIRPPKHLIEKVASRPYDVLNSEEARKEAEGNPMSLYHIIKPEIDFPAGTDEHDECVYGKAVENFRAFRNNGWLVQDDTDHYYIYAQTMDGRTQYGIVVAANVHDYVNGVIKKHELTRRDKEDDRMRHVQVNNANIEPVFFAYPDDAEIDAIVADLGQITGQKAIVCKARKSVANFKLREGMPIGAKVTLRGERMYEFVDFRGINGNSFDGRGNYAFGLKEQIIFPEIDFDKVDAIRGMDICFVTTAKTDEEAKELLKALGAPFAN